MSIVVRTVRNGVVKINGRLFFCDVPCDLVGRFAFGTYPRGDHEEPFVCLWGTERMFKASHRMVDEDDAEYADSWNEFCRLVSGPPLDGLVGVPSGSYHMDEENGNWKAYPSKGYDWWHTAFPAFYRTEPRLRARASWVGLS